MLRTSLTFLAGIGAGLTGVLAICALKRWRSINSTGCSSRSSPRNRLSSRSRRQLKLYHTVDGTALPNTPNEHVFPFRSSRCVWLVSELGIQDSVEIIKIDLQSQDAVGYRDTVHPHTTLPALQLEDGSVMLESAAICLYLAETFLDPKGQNLLPDKEYSACYYE